MVSPSTPSTRQSRAGILDKTIPQYQQPLADSERVLGPDHPIARLIRTRLATARGTS